MSDMLNDWAYEQFDYGLNDSEPVLYRYEDRAELRNATRDELWESIEAAKHDGGRGVISVVVDGEPVDCFVI